MRNPHEALRAIEVLVGGDFGLDMEMIATPIKKGGKKIDHRLKQAAELITTIYMIAHAENGCKHPDWENKKYEILRDAENAGIINPRIKPNSNPTHP